MKKFLLVPNFNRDSLPSVERATSFLQKNGCAAYCLAEDEGRFKADVCLDPIDIDCIMVFGGDGTMLQTVKRFASLHKPFIGINTGKVGYLADIKAQDPEVAIGALLAGKFTEERRVMLRVEAKGLVYSAVNEATVHRLTARILETEIDINGQKAELLRADGVLVATPTGSTAYNLSAGGPVLSPQSRTLVLTPICAHSLTSRPIVVGEDDEITLSVRGTLPAALLVDGEELTTLAPGERVTITIGTDTFTLLRSSESSFFTTLRKKLSAWEE